MENQLNDEGEGYEKERKDGGHLGIGSYVCADLVGFVRESKGS
jgi:hypothetical protein